MVIGLVKCQSIIIHLRILLADIGMLGECVLARPRGSCIFVGLPFTFLRKVGLCNMVYECISGKYKGDSYLVAASSMNGYAELKVACYAARKCIRHFLNTNPKGITTIEFNSALGLVLENACSLLDLDSVVFRCCLQVALFDEKHIILRSLGDGTFVVNHHEYIEEISREYEPNVPYQMDDLLREAKKDAKLYERSVFTMKNSDTPIPTRRFQIANHINSADNLIIRLRTGIESVSIKFGEEFYTMETKEPEDVSLS